MRFGVEKGPPGGVIGMQKGLWRGLGAGDCRELCGPEQACTKEV
jgi:hypothetical protein